MPGKNACATNGSFSANGLPQIPTHGRVFASAARPSAHGRAEALPKPRRSRRTRGRPIDGNRVSTRNYVPASAAQENVPQGRDHALALASQGKYAEAEPLLLRALEAREKELGPDKPELVPAIEELAALYRAQGSNAEAEKLYLRSLQLRENA